VRRMIARAASEQSSVRIVVMRVTSKLLSKAGAFVQYLPAFQIKCRRLAGKPGGTGVPNSIVRRRCLLELARRVTRRAAVAVGFVGLLG
jgi:hypothetical protein